MMKRIMSIKKDFNRLINIVTKLHFFKTVSVYFYSRFQSVTKICILCLYCESDYKVILNINIKNMNMVKKRCMRRNICNEEKLTVYRFPSELTEADNRENWIRVCGKIRKDLVVGRETVHARIITNIFI